MTNTVNIFYSRRFIQKVTNINPRGIQNGPLRILEKEMLHGFIF
jgi:hypothetical protein